jgi:hypothetical protein
MPVVGSCPAAQDVGARDRRGDRHREMVLHRMKQKIEREAKEAGKRQAEGE